MYPEFITQHRRGLTVISFDEHGCSDVVGCVDTVIKEVGHVDDEDDNEGATDAHVCSVVSAERVDLGWEAHLDE